MKTTTTAMCILDKKTLIDALETTVFCASKEASKGVLQSVNLSINNKILDIAATDGHRLAHACIIVDQDSNLKSSINPSKKQVKNLIKLLKSSSKKDSEVVINVLDYSFDFSLGKDRLSLDDEYIINSYPNYKELIPSRFKNSFVLNTNQLLDEILTVKDNWLYDGNNKHQRNQLVLDIRNNVINFAINKDGNNSNIQKLNIYDGYCEDMIIGFNIDYFMDYLKRIKKIKQEIKINLNKWNHPMVIRTLDNRLSYLLMPLSLRKF